LKELAALAYRDTTAENREFWKNEMGQALREIQQIYDEKLDVMRGEMETFYNLKVGIVNCGKERVFLFWLLLCRRKGKTYMIDIWVWFGFWNALPIELRTMLCLMTSRNI